MTCGDDSTLTLVTEASAVMAKLGILLMIKKGLFDGKVKLFILGKLDEAGPSVLATWSALKKNWVPYCRESGPRSTSAIVASISTCSGMMSILRSIPSMTAYSLGVAYINKALLRRLAMIRIRFSVPPPGPVSVDNGSVAGGETSADGGA